MNRPARAPSSPHFSLYRRMRNKLCILDRIEPKLGRMTAENIVDDRIVRKFEGNGVFN
ncbi:MAG TPA: hypothetical protein VKR81_05205 [Candidatus Binatia bacterium]|nr:hypothetical protein [Candidatus Binatia bacterium]